MEERDLKVRVEGMCKGCAFLDEKGVCNRPWIKSEGQKRNAEAGLCADTGVYDANHILNLGTRVIMPDESWVTMIVFPKSKI